jgi:hypothetical protein
MTIRDSTEPERVSSSPNRADRHVITKGFFMKSFISLMLVVCILCSFPGCVTVATGGGEDQAVRVSSTPKGADVFINDELVGKTPMSIRLPRKDDHHVRIEKVGYQPYEKELHSGMNGWLFGNILLGGLIGLGVACSPAPAPGWTART